MQLSQPSGRFIEEQSKLKPGHYRSLSLDDEAIGALMGWKLRQDIERDSWGADYVESSRV